jgi:hypothetical protein
MAEGRRPLSIHEATVSTASIEVKTLTIKGRQVTQAVFRQLQEESLFDYETMEPLGAPWGWVNYHPDKCGDAPEHLHVVWQLDDQLRRHRMDRQWTDHIGIENQVRGDAVNWWITKGMGLDWSGWSKHWPDYEDPRAYSSHAPRGKWIKATDDWQVFAPEPAGMLSSEMGRRAWLDKAYPEGWDERLLAQNLRESIVEREELRSRWENAYAELQALPQLFIAV